MTRWNEILGQDAAVRVLRRAVAADEVSHAWLFIGPAAVGQQEAARALACALNCPDSDGEEGCGSCSTCERIGRGVHPAYTDLEPEGAFHVVDAVRGEWTALATRTLSEGRRRVLRVASADRMNEAAQNAFLKMLEEPAPSVVWVLDAQDESALLETIISRCRRVDLVAWGPDAMRALARRLGLGEDDVEPLSRAAMGSPGRLAWLAEPDVAAARVRHLGIVARLATDGPGSVVPLAKELTAWTRQRQAQVKESHEDELARLEEAYGVESGRGWPPGVRQRLTRRFERLERQARAAALELVLDDLGSYLRDLLVVQGAGSQDALINLDRVEELRADADRLTTVDIVAVLRAVARCREALARNGNPELQLERMLMTLALPLYTRRVA